MPTPDHPFAALDAAFEAVHRHQRVPGVAWGVIRDCGLVHAGGIGTIRDGEAATPDADSVFRIASMTKSFTAAAILLLRDEGRLGLDDPVGAWVPVLEGWRGATADTGPITIRQLLTMTAGLPTDDPWGDRQQALPFDAFEELLRARPALAWPPEARYEYSNLGYGILGQVVTAAAGQAYRTFVRDRLMLPLGMPSSGYGEEEVPTDCLAHGYVRRDGALVREGTDAYGALASMGGVYSTVRDLARWVAGFLDAFPARDDPEGGHPLRRASRREMQRAHLTWPMSQEAHAAHVAPVAESGGYGFGLWATSVADVGTVVGHGGGYPGYGSKMTWHPASGLGVVALGNLRYAPLHDVVTDQLKALVRAELASGRRRALRPHDRLGPAVEAAERLLRGWDDGLADAWFAMNLDLDEPREARRAAVEAAVAAVGGPASLAADPSRPVTATSPLHRGWWLRGERGWLDLEVLLSPESAPRIQTLRVTPVVDPSPSLREALGRLLAAADGGRWPAGLPATDAVDRDLVMRGLRALLARIGTLPAGPVTGGDGATTATWEVGPAPAAAIVRIVLDPPTGSVSAVAVLFPDRDAPTEAW
ncbi:MAG TPA: serine hydrolase domain-containing protein [Candidatus Limnocylindrales bacterium]|nr:serine hydrolase domain-containing protein [Candidatus Limnocylindrales bacterium]